MRKLKGPDLWFNLFCASKGETTFTIQFWWKCKFQSSLSVEFNFGELSTGEVVASTDSKEVCVVDQTWLHRVLLTFSMPRYNSEGSPAFAHV